MQSLAAVQADGWRRMVSLIYQDLIEAHLNWSLLFIAAWGSVKDRSTKKVPAQGWVSGGIEERIHFPALNRSLGRAQFQAPDPSCNRACGVEH